MKLIRGLIGLSIALFSIPITAIAYFNLILGGLLFAIAQAIDGLGEWVAK